MYQQLQDLLTLAIELVAVIGYGGILAHYIINKAFLTKNQGDRVSASPDSLPTARIDTATEAGNTDTTNTEKASSIPDTLCTSPQLAQVDQLTLRQCRAVIQAINKTLPKNERIRLKLNNKDAPTSWLRSQIKKHLENQPPRASVIEEIRPNYGQHH